MDAKAVDQAEGGTVEMGLAPGKQQGFLGVLFLLPHLRTGPWMKGGGRGPGTWHRNLERGLVSVHKIVLWSIAWNRAAEQAQQAHCQDCAHNRMLCVLSSVLLVLEPFDSVHNSIAAGCRPAGWCGSGLHSLVRRRL